MSPKLFEYKGIVLRFYSNDHLPVHVHAIYGNIRGMKVELIQQNGKIKEIVYKKLKGYKKLEPSQIKDLEKMIKKYSGLIIEHWVDYFVSGKTNIKTIKI